MPTSYFVSQLADAAHHRREAANQILRRTAGRWVAWNGPFFQVKPSGYLPVEGRKVVLPVVSNSLPLENEPKDALQELLAGRNRPSRISRHPSTNCGQVVLYDLVGEIGEERGVIQGQVGGVR